MEARKNVLLVNCSMKIWIGAGSRDSEIVKKKMFTFIFPDI